MSEDTTQQEAVTVEQVDAAPGATTDVEETGKTFDEAYVKKLRDEAASYRVKLKEYEDRDKSEAEKAAERMAELERENEEFKRAVERAEWMKEASRETNLPLEALDLIQGNDKESFLGAARQIRSLIPEARTVIPGAAEQDAQPLNGDGIESALRKALGIK